MDTTAVFQNSTPSQSAALGTHGENYACSYIRDLGWTILDRNWRCRFGEIDIVALTHDENTSNIPILIFIEVKTRSNTQFGDPLEAITPEKCAHMRRAAISWLACHHTKTPQLIRFDAIGISVKNNRVTNLTHVRRIMS